MSNVALQVRQLSVGRSRRVILQIDRLEVRCGEAVVVLGPNGAGKSTLLKCLAGFVASTSGEVEIFGNRVLSRRSAELAKLRRRIGYVPQVLAARSETPLTLREVVAIGRTGIAGLFRRLTGHDWALVDLWLDRLGLSKLASQAYSSLSGGEQRKAVIAKAMVQQPELLMLDEPTANLDLFWREQIVATIEELHAELSLTVLLVCHELEVIPACTGRLLLLQDGAIVADGCPNELLTPTLIRSLYGPRLGLITANGRYAAVPTGEAKHA